MSGDGASVTPQTASSLGPASGYSLLSGPQLRMIALDRERRPRTDSHLLKPLCSAERLNCIFGSFATGPPSLSGGSPA